MLDRLADDIRACRHCKEKMPHAPRPILQVGTCARIAIFSQAPGNIAHQKGKPFYDPSGVRLREWLQVSEDDFYDSDKFIIAPMGFCFPGYDKNGGDLPPLKECAAVWRAQLMAALPQVELALLVGGYAQKWHLGARVKPSLTATVAAWRDYGPIYLPTPHPSWRNNGWLKKNLWFEDDVLPHLRTRVRALM
ncbi:MAG: uracil-DNA glycosylase family protein [Pseudomonadota bacterium]